MAFVVITSHEVRDFDVWKKGFDAHKGARTAAGFEEIYVGRDAANPKVAHIAFRVPSAEAAHGFLNAPNLKEAMEAAGVVGAPTSRVIET